MWSTPEEPPGTMEEGPPESAMQVTDRCEQNKSQLESFKEIMLRNQQSLKKKEEEVQEYGRRLSKIKSRTKLSRRSKESAASPKDSVHKDEPTVSDTFDPAVDDINQARTPKAKSTLLQKKLAENRKAFEQRTKEITESKRAVEEKVEAIRQQLDEKDAGTMGYKELPVTPIRPLAATSDILSTQQNAVAHEKEIKIVELTNKILELEASLLDVQENLKEKDSVIESKTMAVTLMSADLSKKGKTTLDALEETKDEMRTMQEHFVLLETSLKDKNENLLQQLKERDDKITTLEETVTQFEQQINEQEKSASATIDFSRSTMDMLVETKDAMKSMQENFVLIETSLKAKNDNLLQQLEAYEIKLAEANERAFKLESGMGIVKDPSVDDLQFKIDKLELRNKQLQDEKYELQKNVAEMQDTIINRSVHSDGALIEKDNRIAELEILVVELKQSNKFLEEESKAELQKQLADVTLKNEQYFNKINDLEKIVNDLEIERGNLIARLPDENAAAKEDDKVVQLTKELEELNKTMIKIKAQHRSKVKNLQKQLKNFKKVSDTNAELVRLGNQVTLLEEEKGNLQLSLVDFDELKASTGDLQEHVADLESKVSVQMKEIQTHIEAIAILENQKLDLTQELHLTKQEISALEAENAESENLRVTAEMKVVDLEEQMDSLHKTQKDSTNITFSVPQSDELLKKIAVLTHENNELYNKLLKLEEKVASDSGSTESFEAIQELDKTDLLKTVEDLKQRNSELTEKLSKLEEKSNSHGGSTDSFETISDGDKTVLLRKIDQLTQENTDLMMKLSRIEEKGSSDTGSTESFERIPEHCESTNKIEFLTQENHELMEKLTKLEEQLEHLPISQDNNTKFETVEKAQLDSLLQEKNVQSQEMQMLKEKIDSLSNKNVLLETRVEALLAENSKLISLQAGHEDFGNLEESIAIVRKRSTSDSHENEQVDILVHEKSRLEKEVKELRNAIEQLSRASSDEIDADSLRTQVQTLMKDNVRILKKVDELEELNKNLKDELNDAMRDKDELLGKINSMTFESSVDERRQLIDELEKLNLEKENVARERQDLQEQINAYLHRPNEESSEVRVMDAAPQNMEAAIVASLEREIEDSKKLIAEQTDLIDEMKLKLSNKERELEKKRKIIEEYESSGNKKETLEQDLKEMSSTMEEWKYKCYDMESKMSILEAGKASIEEGFRLLQKEHDSLLEETREKETSCTLMKEELQSTINVLEKRLQDMMSELSAKEQEVANLKEEIESKNDELNKKYAQLQTEMITVDNLQDEVTYCTALLQEKQNVISSLTSELDELKEMLRNKDDEIYSLRREVTEFHERLQNSKSIEEYNSLVQAYERKEEMLHEMERQFDEYKREGSEVSMKLQRLLVERDDLETQITRKENEYVHLMKEKEDLKDKITEVQREKSNAERRIYELQTILDNNAKFVDNLQMELKDAYRQIEQVELKYTKDMEMQNQRLELLIKELDTKAQENYAMKVDLEEKERLVGQNVTEEMKIAFETQITSLEEKLAAAEDKIQAQIEKMKKIAANLKRKTNVCQELEARVTELEEKLTSEKDEKEAKNRQIQDVEIIIREKDNRIVDLHDKLTLALTDASEAATNLQKVTEELTDVKEKMLLLTEQIAEMGEEVIKLRTVIDAKTQEYTAEKDAKEAIQKAFEKYRQGILEETQQKELKLEEVTETARELRVRMDVMEQEYVEQLGLISNLKTENGLLLSKQAQINEKLENVEKESDERRILVEQLQARVGHTVEVSTQVFEDHITDGAPEASGMRRYNNYEECQALISTLEAKVQDRDAELQKLSSELANAISNVVEISNISETHDTYEIDVRNRTIIEKVEELVNQYKTLERFNVETRVKLTDAVTETNRLRTDIENLQLLNVTLEEKLITLQKELDTGNVSGNIAETIDTTKAEMYDQQLLSLQEKLEVEKMQADQLHQELNLKIVQLQNEKQQLSEKEESLQHMQDSLEDEITNLKMEKSAFSQKMTDLKAELQRYKREESIEPRAISDSALAFERVVDDQDNAPQLFDASKIFGSAYVSESDTLTSNEMVKLQNELRGKEIYCSNLTQEIEHLKTQITEERSQLAQDCNRYSDELRVTQDRLSVAQADLERLEKLVTEKNVQIDSLNTELSNVDLQIMTQCNQQDESDTKLEELVSLKDNQINELKAELSSTTEILEVLTAERDQQVRQSESNRVQIANLEAELRHSNDTELIQELEKKIFDSLTERDLLQSQVNHLTRSMEELQITIESGRNLQIELETALREKAEAKESVANLTRALEEIRKGSAELKSQEESATQETITELAVANPFTALDKHTEVKASEAAIDLDTGLPFNVDEEMWDWNADVIQLADQDHVTPIIPSEEAKLRAQVGDLEDKIKELEIERERITEESKAAQVRSGKLVKKLKEYKVQVENLQQQLKIQKSASDFYELDSAIEEELKAQISKLEKTLNESKEDQKAISAEKDSLLKRLDVITSANERYMELKEKQDLEMEVLRIQNKELTNKINALDLRLHDNNGSIGVQMLQQTEQVTGLMEESASSKSDKQRHKRSTEEHSELVVLYKRCKDELDDLKDQMEALAIENEQLQHTLENLKDTHDQQQANEKNSSEIIQELTSQCSKLQDALGQSEKKYDDLREQYEQCVLKTNDQQSIMQQNADALRLEAHEQINKFNVEITNLQEQLKESNAKADALLTNLENSLQEKSKLQEKVSQLLATEERLAVANSSLADVTDLLNVRIQEVADLKQELQKQYIDWENREVTFQNTIQSATSELNVKKEELDSLRRSLSDKENELVQCQGVETVSAIVSQATQELMQKHAIEIEEKDNEIRSLREKAATLQIAVDEYALDMQSNIAKLEAQQQEFDLMQQNILQKDSILVSIQTDLQSAKDAAMQNEMDLCKQLKLSQELTSEKEQLLQQIDSLVSQLNEASPAINVEEYNLHINNFKLQLQNVTSALEEKQLTIEKYELELKEFATIQEERENEIKHLQEEIGILKNGITNKTEEVSNLKSELDVMREAFEGAKRNLEEKSSLLEKANQSLRDKQLEFNNAFSAVQSELSPSNIVDGLPLFRMGDNESEKLQSVIDALRSDLQEKMEEIEHFKYMLNENTYPSILQELQERINLLYNEKAGLESSLEVATQTVTEKERALSDLRQRVEIQSQEFMSKEEASSLSRERRSIKDQEEIVRLQNELHSKEQEINDLKYIISEKDSQLSLQASMEPQSDDYELREMRQRLYIQEQEIEHLKRTIADLQKEVSRLAEFETLSTEYRIAIEKLSAEKEHIRLEGEEFLENKLKEKEFEIDDIKQKLVAENQKILEQLQLRETDLQNIKLQLEESSIMVDNLNGNLQQKEHELMQVNIELEEKERRLAELSITKDAELHNLKVQIHEKEVRIEELVALSEVEEKQLFELRSSLDSCKIEINALKKLLEDKVKEYELIQHALKKDVSILGAPSTHDSASESASGEVKSQELDVALYMLHQRDVRCEELTHELMQLLEERDTLQLRLSNAIRVNEELRRVGGTETSPKIDAPSISGSEDLLVEHPSPSKSEGPVEIAKEAIDAPIGEDKEALAVKLSQLHTVSHAKDVRLRDERELRHTQQMSLLAHKDVLSTLPPEAAARLVNANYTLSRDVQSQSSVLLNWLWGKSTPKVVHM